MSGTEGRRTVPGRGRKGGTHRRWSASGNSLSCPPLLPSLPRSVAARPRPLTTRCTLAAFGMGEGRGEDCGCRRRRHRMRPGAGATGKEGDSANKKCRSENSCRDSPTLDSMTDSSRDQSLLKESSGISEVRGKHEGTVHRASSFLVDSEDFAIKL